MFDERKGLLFTFQEQLEHSVGLKLDLKINDNRSTMLSVKWAPNCTKVSLHRMFLQAPRNVMEALACYLKGTDKKIAPTVKAYIETNLQKLDYSKQIDCTKLDTLGKTYDLRAIYQMVNREYFDNPLDLQITWFGKGVRKACTRLTFGLYYDPLRLIKINRLLDNPFFPPFFVAYVIYHEMLHYVYPSYVDKKGHKHIHSKIFKEREKKFKFFKEAHQWIKEHQDYLFNAS
jgi:hypothetical protein